MEDLHFLYTLKWLVISRLLIFFFLTHKYTNSAFSSWILFLYCLSLFQDFLVNQTHIVKISFWFLEAQGSTIDYIYGLLRLSKALQNNIDTTVLSLQYKNFENKL